MKHEVWEKIALALSIADQAMGSALNDSYGLAAADGYEKDMKRSLRNVGNHIGSMRARWTVYGRQQWGDDHVRSEDEKEAEIPPSGTAESQDERVAAATEAESTEGRSRS